MNDLLSAFRKSLVEYGIEAPFRPRLDDEDLAFVIHSYVDARYPEPKQKKHGPVRVTKLGARRTVVLEHVVDRAQLARAWLDGGPETMLKIMVETDAAHPDEVDVP